MAIQDDLEKLATGTRVVRSSFLTLGIMIILLSLSTIFWDEGVGYISESSIHYHLNGNNKYPPNGYYGRFGGTFSWVSAKYTYKVGETRYQSRLLCVCLPVGLNVKSKGQEVTVYYLPFYPAISVLFRGPHLFLGVSLLFFSLGFGALERKIRKFRRKAGDSSLN